MSTTTTPAPISPVLPEDEMGVPVADSQVDSVDSVGFKLQEDLGDGIVAGQPAIGRGTLGLCPPPRSEVDSVDFGAESTPNPVDSEDSDIVGVDLASDSQARKLRLLALVGTDEDPYRAGGPWAYADAENCGGRVFLITQNVEYGGVVIFGEEQVTKAVERKGMTRWAWAKHDKDRVSEYDRRKNPALVLGDLKADHIHVAVERKSFATIGAMARIFGVPPEQVEVKPQGSFLDLVEYLTHEHPNQQSKGKFWYPDDQVQASFSWRTEVDDNKLARSFKAGQRANSKKMAAISLAVNNGEMTLRQVRDLHPDIYVGKGVISHLQKLRGDYLAQQDAPESVVNFYVYGPGGVGKDLLAKALARALAPDEDKPYFKVGGENVSWEGYDGEPVVIWEDMRVGEMIRTAKSRGMLFRILGPWREPDEKPIVNVKGSHTQLLNRVNIVTGPEDYETFLRGLAGEYESMQHGIRVKHRAENLDQGFRRFPVIIPVAEHEFSIFVNLGVLNGTREYQSYERHEHMRQSLELLNRRCKAITDAAERERVRAEIEGRTVAPIVEQHDRIARPDLTEVQAADVLAEFADAGEPISTPDVTAPAQILEGEIVDDSQTIADLQAQLADVSATVERQRMETERRRADAERRQREAEERSREAKLARVRDAGFDLSVLAGSADPFATSSPLIRST